LILCVRQDSVGAGAPEGRQMIFEGHVMKKWWEEPAMEGRRRSGEAGFTLMELLIVMAVILILMLVAIPSMLNVTIQAHETSALASLRAIQAAEVQYSSNFPANGFACTLSSLGGTSSSGAPTPQAAQMLQSTLAMGQKDGYTFNITNCTKTTGSNNQDMFTSYEVTAVPQTVGRTGHRGFCMDMSGEIKADMAGGTNCTVPIS
jgi:type IV pilus assembly protein PilA